jgi:hypothetical protein
LGAESVQAPKGLNRQLLVMRFYHQLVNVIFISIKKYIAIRIKDRVLPNKVLIFLKATAVNIDAKIKINPLII